MTRWLTGDIVNADMKARYDAGSVTMEEFARWNYEQNLLAGRDVSYAVGTTNVPYNMKANIHKGEAIIPKNFSDGLRSGDLMIGSNKDLRNELIAMRQDNMQLKSLLVSIAGSNEKLLGTNRAMLGEMIA